MSISDRVQTTPIVAWQVLPEAVVGPDASPTADALVDTTPTLQLSLFLMLLTFFLVLTANSKFDAARVGSVIGGVQSAFGYLDGGRLDDAGSLSGAPLAVQAEGAVPASGVFATSLEASFSPLGGTLQVNGASFDIVIRADRIFVGGAAALRADQHTLLTEIGRLLGEAGTNRHIAVLVPSEPVRRLDIRRAASIARLLIEAGTPAAQIAVGVSRETITYMTFRFYQFAEGAI